MAFIVPEVVDVECVVASFMVGAVVATPGGKMRRRLEEDLVAATPPNKEGAIAPGNTWCERKVTEVGSGQQMVAAFS